MHRRHPLRRSRWIHVLLVLAASLLIAACGSGSPALSPAPSSPLSPAPSTGGEIALVSVEYRGGDCREGECKSVVTIAPNGTVKRDLGQTASVPQPLLAALVDAIRATNFPAVLSRPFTGECPTAFDGQELVYTIATPSDGQVAIASCEVEVDPAAPLFAAIERIVELAP